MMFAGGVEGATDLIMKAVRTSPHAQDPVYLLPTLRGLARACFSIARLLRAMASVHACVRPASALSGADAPRAQSRGARGCHPPSLGLMWASGGGQEPEGPSSRSRTGSGTDSAHIRCTHSDCGFRARIITGRYRLTRQVLDKMLLWRRGPQ